jgi:molecular chaperone GrpE
MRRGNGKSEENIDLRNDLRGDSRNQDSRHENAERGVTAVQNGVLGEDERGPVSIAGKGDDAPAATEAEKLKAERDALLDRLARLQAEFDNARKRAVKEQQEFREFAAADAIKNFLPVLDSFERALKAHADASDFRGGVELIYRQFQDALLKTGVQPIVAVGQMFDPRVHEAVEMVDTTDAPDQQVLDEFQRGYKYKERLLRPAMVRVARNGG